MGAWSGCVTAGPALPVLNAMDDPEHRELLEEMIGRMRGALAPMLNAAMKDGERFLLLQGMMISAAAVQAGLTVGHMIAVGNMEPRDVARARKVVQVNFRNGIKFGEREARDAMLQQMPPEGRA
jgi:hypothetical protein